MPKHTNRARRRLPASRNRHINLTPVLKAARGRQTPQRGGTEVAQELTWTQSRREGLDSFARGSRDVDGANATIRRCEISTPKSAPRDTSGFPLSCGKVHGERGRDGGPRLSHARTVTKRRDFSSELSTTWPRTCSSGRSFDLRSRNLRSKLRPERKGRRGLRRRRRTCS